MERSLARAAAGRGLPRIADFRELGLRPEGYGEAKVFGLLDAFARAYGEGIVLYGGITATERVYGLKRIRGITTDLDFVCTREGLAEVLDRQPGLLYHEGFDILFTVADNLPVTFASGHIHDWEVTADFLAAALPRRPGAEPVRCASRDHSIMLKCRRAVALLRRGLPPFGKDALDILNMVAAPAFRADLPPVGVPALADLVREGTGADRGELAGLIGFLRGHMAHLRGAETAAAEEVLSGLAAAWGFGRG